MTCVGYLSGLVGLVMVNCGVLAGTPPTAPEDGGARALMERAILTSLARSGALRAPEFTFATELDPTPDFWRGATSEQQNLLTNLWLRPVDPTRPAPACCFAPGTSEEVVAAFEEALLNFSGLRFQLTNRWSTTAMSGGGLGEGDPTIITYSFVPDGTIVPAAVGPTGPSQLNAWMNGLYGSPAAWHTIYAEVFDRWSALSGLSYVYEPNDDGVQLNSALGQAGVRGDVRIAAVPLDGNSGVLAYNQFPDDGDMVLDANDSFFSDTTQSSRRLRNVVAHEHGHGMGLLHVCPANQTKLMEPFVSTAYLGPQLDDILAVQRHYGDANEPNDTAAQATQFGVMDGGGRVLLDVSCDDDADVDMYAFDVTSFQTVTAQVLPQGATYTQGPQTGNCNGGSSFNSLTVNDLGVQIIDSDGVTALSNANAAAAGFSETTSVTTPRPGRYFVRVYAGAANSIQRYSLVFTATPANSVPPSISLPEGAPSLLSPGVPASFAVGISAGTETIVGTPVLLYRSTAGGAYATRQLVQETDDTWQATLPGFACGSTPQFYVSVTGDESGEITQPAGGAAAPLTAQVGAFSVAFEDNFETNRGWVVSGTVGGGAWARGIPANGNRGDPATDADGSGRCFVTENVAGNSDVDDGSTILTSPPINAALGGTVTYSYWLNDIANGRLTAEDGLFVDYATNAAGTNWVRVRTFNTAASQWRTDSISIGAGGNAPASATFRLRFTAADLGTQNVVEAGLDAVRLSSFVCVDPPPVACPCDWNQADALDSQDFFDFLEGFFSGDADFNHIDGTDSQDLFDFLECFFSVPEGC